jgi:hypothetical protein
MTGPERILHLIRSVEYLVGNSIPGSIVECGVWRGGSMMTVALTLIRCGVTNRDLYLYDTFEGMTDPGEIDRRYDGVAASEILASTTKTTDDPYWAYASLADVKKNLNQTGYPAARLHYIQGSVEQTVPNLAPSEVALLRLDTDWYSSTRHELVHLYPRLQPHGVLIIDDYGWWEGARRAVDEYFHELDFSPLLHRIDETARSCIKP